MRTEPKIIIIWCRTHASVVRANLDHCESMQLAQWETGRKYRPCNHTTHHIKSADTSGFCPGPLRCNITYQELALQP